MKLKEIPFAHTQKHYIGKDSLYKFATECV